MQKLIARLADIPVEYRPIPFRSWNDQLDEEELRRLIQWMHQNGINGFFMHARGGLKTPYPEIILWQDKNAAFLPSQYYFKRINLPFAEGTHGTRGRFSCPLRWTQC